MAMDAIDEALLAQARILYFQYLKLDIISKKTGLSTQVLHPHIHGSHPDDPESWFMLRRISMQEGFNEDAERNRYAAHRYATVAMDHMMRSADLLNSRLKFNKKSGKEEMIPLTVFEMDAYASSLTKIDKLLRLTSGLPTEIIDIPGARISDAEKAQGLDMTEVILALSRDKSIRNRLLPAIEKEQVNGQHNTGHNDEGQYPTNQGDDLQRGEPDYPERDNEVLVEPIRDIRARSRGVKKPSPAGGLHGKTLFADEFD